MNVEPGDEAPDFTLYDQDGNVVSLRALRGQPVVLYFYPADETPGCTTQACGIRDAWDAFERAGARVLGVSPDDVESHARFKQNHDLPHTLLADPGREVLETYGAWGEKNLYGKRVVGVKRSTVLIDADGRVAVVWKRAVPKTHAEKVLAALGELDDR